MKKMLAVAAIHLFGIAVLFAGNERQCASNDYLQQKLAADPALEMRMNDIEMFTQRFIQNSTMQRESATVIRIPVVVHVLWRTAGENISDAQIQSQIDVLNEDFRKMNADFNQTLPEFIDRGADYEIEFCLASTDPLGNPTNGIERKQTTKSSWGTNDAVKKLGSGGLNAWDADKYLNMWVCNIGGGILGYATFPGGSKSLDGVVILFNAFGRVGNVAAPFDEGATTTHEVGHWLNLRHIWGDASCGNDFVDDTPKASGANYGCPLNKVSCSNKNMVQNYMDYTDDACMTLFTQGQKTRSMALFAPGGFRYPLLSSTACGVAVPTCGIATPVVSNISNTSAGLSFPAVNNATGYFVEISTNGTLWIPAGAGPNTSYNLGSLLECTGYQVRVTTFCAGIDTTVSAGVTFTTTGAACTCTAPANLAVSNINYKSAKATWSAVAGASSYEVRRKQVTQTTWKVFPITTNTYKVMTGHTSNKNYEVQVRTKCATTGTSAWSPSVYYTSATYRLSEVAKQDIAVESFVTIFPNPATNSLTLEYFGELLQDARISIFDITGRVAQSFTQVLEDGSNTHLDISGLSNGLYFVKIYSEGKVIDAQKVLISK